MGYAPDDGKHVLCEFGEGRASRFKFVSRPMTENETGNSSQTENRPKYGTHKMGK